jgi:hypothetical protein
VDASGTARKRQRHSRQRIRPEGVPNWAYIAAGGCLALAFGYVAFSPIVQDGDGETLSAGTGARDACIGVPLICPSTPPLRGGGVPPPPLSTSTEGSVILPQPSPSSATPTPEPTTPAATPSAAPSPKPAPRLVQILLSSLGFTRAENGRGPVERNQSNGEREAGDGRTLTIDGEQFSNGLGVHAPSRVQIQVSGRCTQFTAVVGVDDEKDDSDEDGRVVFRVLADGRTVAQSPILDYRDAGFTLTADIARANIVDLLVDSAGSQRSDHADWADARFTCIAG